MMITAFNAVNLRVSNNNNRRNNNNNNNNDNNDNNGQIQEANTMGDIDEQMGMVVLPPLPGRRLFTRSVKNQAAKKYQPKLSTQNCL